MLKELIVWTLSSCRHKTPTPALENVIDLFVRAQRKLFHFKEILVRFVFFVNDDPNGFNLLQERLKRNNLDNAANEWLIVFAAFFRSTLVNTATDSGKYSTTLSSCLETTSLTSFPFPLLVDSTAISSSSLSWIRMGILTSLFSIASVPSTLPLCCDGLGFRRASKILVMNQEIDLFVLLSFNNWRE